MCQGLDIDVMLLGLFLKLLVSFVCMLLGHGQRVFHALCVLFYYPLVVFFNF